MADNNPMRSVARRFVHKMSRLDKGRCLFVAGIIAVIAVFCVGAEYRAHAQTTANELEVFLPIVSVHLPQVIEFNTGYVERCVPNPGVSYVNGTTALGGTPVSGQMVVVSYEPDGPIVAQVESGPHAGYPNWPEGFFSHILSTAGPREADWHFWIVDESNRRISVIVYLHTDDWEGSDACQQAIIRFDHR